MNLLLLPIAELSEILDQTQIAIAGWRKILGVLATPDRRGGARSTARSSRAARSPVDLDGVRFAYRSGDEVLRGIDLHLPAGAAVAVVGETGSGKTTIAKLLCRLADPTDGRRARRRRRPARRSTRRRGARVDPDGAAGRLPVRHDPRPRTSASGAPDATDDEVRAAFAALGLGGVARRPARRPRRRRSASGARTCPWASASSSRSPAPSWAIPGLLILDEATSSVDPETEQALTEALERAVGRAAPS